MNTIGKIKLVTGLLLICFGLYFGIKMLNFDAGQAGIIRVSVAFGIQQMTTVATYTPIYAGLCIIAGAYLIAKIQSTNI